MKSSARIPLQAAAGFAADPDPSTNPEDVPADHVFKAPDSLPTDGSPNVLLAWLEGGAGVETATVEVWGLDEDSAPNDAVLSPVFRASAAHRWSRLVAATAVTNPAVQAMTARLFAGPLYLRQTDSTLTPTDAVLKVHPARL